MITLTRLRQVVTLAEHRSFHRAAATLRISQPALTKSIQVLEATLGVRLFDRQPGGVVLTEFGELVVEHTREMVASESELLRRVSLLAKLESGSIKVAFGPYPSVMAGYVTVGKLLAKHPKLKVTLHVANWREVTRLVAEKKVDVGVAELTDAVLDDTLETELVGQHLGRYFCRPGHPILAKRRVGLADLLQFPWASTRVPPRVAAAFPRPPGAAGHIDPFNGDFVPAIELDVPMQLASLIASSDVITTGSFTFVEKELEAGKLTAIPTPDLKFRASYGFILRKGRSLSPATLAFMHEFRDEDRVCGEREQHFERLYATGEQRRS
jgi:DNA-binding transcriptional LysR family regulator